MTKSNNKRKVRSFSLNTEEDIDILKKLKEVENISDYIKKLIREDIIGGSTLTKGQREEVKRIVIEILKDKSIEVNEKDIDDKFDDDEIDALNELGNI